jgi:hypothetical protein
VTREERIHELTDWLAKELDDEADDESAARMVAFLLAVRVLGGREGLAAAALTCGRATND